MRKRNYGFIILVFSSIIALFLTPYIILSSVPLKNGTGFTSISKFGIFASEVEIYNQIEIGDIKFVELNKESVNLVEVEWNITHTGVHLPPFSIQLTHYISDSRIIIGIKSLVDINDILSLSLIVAFNPSYSIYSFISDTGEGNVKFNAFDINIKNFYFRTSSGKLNIKLNNSIIENNFDVSTDTGDIDMKLDHIYFFENFFCHSNSGIQLFDIWNPKFKSVANFNVTSDIGYIRLHWMNHFNKYQDVNINVNSKGNVKVKFWCPLEIMRSDVLLSTVNGTTVFSKPVNTYEEISENHYQTPIINNTSLDSYNITTSSTSGEAWVYYVNCFKWLRDCNQGMDFFPYNVSLSSNHSMLIQEHDITTIYLFNSKYIYLDEFRTLTINFDTLPVSSDKLLYIEWDLDFIHAMGIGVGWLNLKISHNRIYTTLLVYVELDFRIDRILPTFNEYNITVNYHPNYVFNHFLI
jgi:hypothetical protein